MNEHSAAPMNEHSPAPMNEHSPAPMKRYSSALGETSDSAPKNKSDSGLRSKPRRLAAFLTPALLSALCLLPFPSCLARASAAYPSTSLEPARRALLDGRADEASTLLHKALDANPGDGHAHLLLCRVFLSEELSREAAAECQSALDHGLSQTSEAQDWTGRALGKQASHAGMLSGMHLALDVRTAFETAVNLAPDSEPSCVDLGEFYTAAPAIVGGGGAKALALAARIERSLPEVAHRIRAMAAEKNNDFAAAEREFQAEANVAHRPGALVDLAAFYGRHAQNAKAIAVAKQTVAADHATDATVVEAAGVLADAGEIPAAETALHAYLTHGEHSDQAPVFRAHTQLGDLLARAGQREAARSEYTAALSLASRYAPARKGLATL